MACGRTAPDGSWWEIDGVDYYTNPLYTLDPQYPATVRLWHWMQSGQGGQNGCLPDAGGLFDQAAILMDAFAVIEAYVVQLREAEQKKRTSRW